MGYRSIDTAQAYYNEEGVGEAVAQAVAEGNGKERGAVSDDKGLDSSCGI